jgi:hypothetical protein
MTLIPHGLLDTTVVLKPSRYKEIAFWILFERFNI